MTTYNYNPLSDPGARLCPTGCGYLTDDLDGGPCSDCLYELAREEPQPPPLLRSPSAALPPHRCDDGCGDAEGDLRTLREVATVRTVGDLL